MRHSKPRTTVIPLNRTNFVNTLLLCFVFGATVQVTIDFIWLWKKSYGFSSLTDSIPEHSKNFEVSQRLLIAQYTGLDRYDSKVANVSDRENIQIFYTTLLNFTSKVNQAYAIQWKHDYLLFRGIPYLGEFQNESCGLQINLMIVNGERQQLLEQPNSSGAFRTDTNNNLACNYNFSQSRATYNKIFILELLLSDPNFKGKYDRLLLLDSDAMIYDFSRDMAASFIPQYKGDEQVMNTLASVVKRKDYVFVAHKTNKTDVNNTGSINIGVTLWNLRHPITPYVVQKWKWRSLSRLRRFKDDDDQSPLQHILKEDIPPERRQQVVLAVEGEFGYSRGRFVKHFIRPDFTTWITKDTETKNSSQLNNERLSKIQNALTEVCTKYHPICNF